MKRLLLITFLFVLMGIQASLDARTSTEGMRIFSEGTDASKVKKTETHSGPPRYLRGDYLIPVLGVGAYIKIKRKKSRGIDL